MSAGPLAVVPPPAPRNDNGATDDYPRARALWILASQCVVLTNLAGKELRLRGLHPGFLLLIGFVLYFIVTFAYGAARGAAAGLLQSGAEKLTLLRSACVALARAAAVLAIIYAPAGVLTAVNLAWPLLLLLLDPFFGRPLPREARAPLGVAFLGLLILGSGEALRGPMGERALWGIGLYVIVAFSTALARQLEERLVALREPSEALFFQSSVVGLLCCAPLWLGCGDGLVPPPRAIAAPQVAAGLVALVLCYAGGQLAYQQSARASRQRARLAVHAYWQIPTAVVLDYALNGVLPAPLSWIGMIILSAASYRLNALRRPQPRP